jgi:hypothetical protein
MGKDLRRRRQPVPIFPKESETPPITRAVAVIGRGMDPRKMKKTSPPLSPSDV